MSNPTDMTVPCGDGYLNIRAGAILLRKDGRFLMMGNEHFDYLYAVGGRLHFGETAEEAVIREVEEETGVRLRVNRLGFVHETYFISDAAPRIGETIYEISFYFYMEVPEDFHPVCNSRTEDNSREFLVWTSPDDPRTLYPEFFRTELRNPVPYVRHFVTDDR